MAGVNLTSTVDLTAATMQGIANASSRTTDVGSTESFSQYLDSRTSAQAKSADSSNAEGISQKQDTAYRQTEQVAQAEQAQTPDTEQAAVTAVTEGEGVMQPEESVDETIVDAVVQEVKDIIKKDLGIDDETLDNALETLGFSLADLFNPENLQQLTLTVNDAEAVDFITDENLLADYNNLLQDLQDFVADSELPEADLLEVLDTPVTLEEFMQENPELELSFAQDSEETPVLSDEAGVAMPNEVTVTVTTGENAEAEHTQEPQVLAETVVEHADVRTETAQQEPGTAQQETGGTGQLGQAAVQDAGAEDTADSGTSSDNRPQDAGADMEGLETTEGELPDTAEPQAASLFNEQLGVLQEGTVENPAPQQGALQSMQQMIDIVNQVSTVIRSSLSAETTSVELQLTPESLGHVEISIASKEGVMTATFRVESEEARQALEGQMMTLRESLTEKNLKVESIEVQVYDFDFSQSNEAKNQNQDDTAKQGRRRFRYDVGEEEAGQSDAVEELSAEQTRRQVMLDAGGSIDYTA